MTKRKCFSFFSIINFFLFFYNFSLPLATGNHIKEQLFTTTSTFYNWNDLFNISNDNFATLFLPSYVNFENLFAFNDKSTTFSTLSVQCQRSLQKSLKALSHRENWAVELFNSWAQAFPPTGSLSGTFTDLGDFDQCLGVDKAAISTQYCLLNYYFPMPRPRPKHHNFYHQTPHLLSLEESLKNGSFYRKLEQVSSLFYYTNFQIAICLPSTCSPEDVHIIANKGLFEYVLNIFEKIKHLNLPIFRHNKLGI